MQYVKLVLQVQYVQSVLDILQPTMRLIMPTPKPGPVWPRSWTQDGTDDTPKGVDRAMAPNGGPAEDRSKLMSYSEARGPPLLNESS